ncbi:class II fructose-bisphosphate aldolase [Eubacteriales bacterium OttesenSCG-928-N14]|nr:class II fructose-bisphosphate aldolase [Eubacteriales bacterium OttesenSCG-928-N14]
MLYKTDVLTRQADRQKYGVIAPKVYNFHSLEQCFLMSRQYYAAPIIVRVSAEHLNLTEYAEWAKYFDKKYPQTQISLVAEDITTFEQAAKACSVGYGGVALADSILLNDEKNMGLIRQITRIARASNTSTQVSAGNIKALKDGKGYELAVQAKVDILKLLPEESLNDANIAEYCTLIHALRKQTLITLAMGGAALDDMKYYPQLKESGLSKFDAFESPSSAGVKRAKEVYEAEPEKTKKIFVLDLESALVKGYLDDVKQRMILAGNFAQRH